MASYRAYTFVSFFPTVAHLQQWLITWHLGCVMHEITAWRGGFYAAPHAQKFIDGSRCFPVPSPTQNVQFTAVQAAARRRVIA